MTNQPSIVLEARPGAIRFANEIGNFANKKWRNGAQMAALVASITLQNIVISLMVDMLAPGAEGGHKFLDDFYDGAKLDAKLRWNDADLKKLFKGAPRGGHKN